MVFCVKNVTSGKPLIQLLIEIKHHKYGYMFRLDRLSHLHVLCSCSLKTAVRINLKHVHIRL